MVAKTNRNINWCYKRLSNSSSLVGERLLIWNIVFYTLKLDDWWYLFLKLKMLNFPINCFKIPLILNFWNSGCENFLEYPILYRALNFTYIFDVDHWIKGITFLFYNFFPIWPGSKDTECWESLKKLIFSYVTHRSIIPGPE